MNILTGIQNVLEYINNNWTTIIIIIGLIIAIARKVKNYMSKSTDEKINIAKKQIRETILKLVSDAEQDYDSYIKAGSIKRSQVIQKIFEDYPVLAKVVDQEEIIKWIDDVIDESLNTLREIVSINKECVDEGANQN